jgi:glycosyltransferase involved in cell wall biosynthesis
MNIIFFAHPVFLGSRSMSRYAYWLSEGMTKRSHTTKIWAPVAVLYRIPLPKRSKKWLGYVDQYIIFSIWVKWKLLNQPADTIYVFADNALGPYVSLINNRTHVMHCHDFLAQHSALGFIPQNPTSITGKIYQSYIRNGFLKAKNFISISYKTRDDLHGLYQKKPQLSEVVYNGISEHYKPSANRDELMYSLSKEINIDVSNGYLLHVGGNQWYKNRLGVVNIYNEWRKEYTNDIPLILIGEYPDSEILKSIQNSSYSKDIHILTGKNDEFVRNAYRCASLFLFPSLAEGFGWPIAEAMASGCPVITTNLAPMTEVAGNAAMLIEKAPNTESDYSKWLSDCATIIQNCIKMTDKDRQSFVANGILNTKRFASRDSLDRIEEVYKIVSEKHT